VAAETLHAAEVIHVRDADDDLRGDAHRPAQGRRQDGELRAVALAALDDLGRGGVADGQALVVDVLGDEGLDPPGGLGRILRIADGLAGQRHDPARGRFAGTASAGSLRAGPGRCPCRGTCRPPATMTGRISSGSGRRAAGRPVWLSVEGMVKSAPLAGFSV
jgi:hypothetical protein